MPSFTRPDTSTDEGRLAFNRLLNDKLPTKRNIAQGLLRNEQGEILFCELTYKKEWDLPGGVVDPGESPAHCLQREVREELGIDLAVGSLLAVNWLPPYRGWDDAVLFLFDLGLAPADLLTTAHLLPQEIKAIHFATPKDAAPRLAPYTATMLSAIEGGDHTAYLEDSARP